MKQCPFVSGRWSGALENYLRRLEIAWKEKADNRVYGVCVCACVVLHYPTNLKGYFYEGFTFVHVMR